jgi:hypothetical protein
MNLLIPFHEKSDTDVTPESFAASKFFNCELRIGITRQFKFDRLLVPQGGIQNSK